MKKKNSKSQDFIITRWSFSILLACSIGSLLVNIWTFFAQWQYLITIIVLLVIVFFIRAAQDRNKAIKAIKAITERKPGKSKWQQRLEDISKKEITDISATIENGRLKVHSKTDKGAEKLEKWLTDNGPLISRLIDIEIIPFV